MNEEFNEWLASAYPPTRPLNGAEAFWIKAAWLEATRRAEEKSAIRIGELESALTEIALYAHYNSTGPAVPDHLWDIRRIAYVAL